MPAQQRALNEETAAKQLGKLGGTPYRLRDLTIESKGAFMTAAMLNNLRRDALEKMRKARTEPIQTDRRFVPDSCEMPAQEKLLIVQGEDVAKAKSLIECGVDVFEWQPQIYKADALSRMLAEADGVKPALVLPAVMHSDELEHIHAWVCETRKTERCGSQ